MKYLTLLLLPAALFAGQARYARLGEFEGPVEVQLRAADAWMPAERNLPLPELAWVRTGAGARVEIELDDGSAWRLGPDSQGEISDYSVLSTGQKITLLSLDHGTAYFTGEPVGKDIMMLVVPGAQVSLIHGSRVRAMARPTWSQIAVVEGTVRFSSPGAEMDLREGQTMRVEPANPSRFEMEPGVTASALDKWSEDRDKAEAAPPSAAHVIQRYGVADLDASGQWVQADDLGAVWKPNAADGWVPFQKGRWRWYDTLGYTWVSDEPWGWLPYHYGRWALKDKLGWVWAPTVRAAFKPGEVFWLHGPQLAGWGPLAPGEQFTERTPPQQFAASSTTFAAFQQDAMAIDPAGFAAGPSQPLQAAALTPALPSPAFPASRLDATRPMLRVGSTRILPSVSGVTFQDPTEDARALPQPGADQRPVVMVSDAPDDAPPPPPDGVYPPVMPVMTDVIVLNPADHPDYSPPRYPPSRPASPGTAASGGSQPTQLPAPQPSRRPASAASGNPPPPPIADRDDRRGPPPVTLPAPNPSRSSTSAPPATPPPPSAPRENPREHAAPQTAAPPAPSAPAPAAAPPPAAPRVEAPRVEAPKVEAPKASDTPAAAKKG